MLIIQRLDKKVHKYYDINRIGQKWFCPAKHLYIVGGFEMAEIHGSKTKTTSIHLCGAQGCCPIVEIHHDTNEVVIIDDCGGRVVLTKEQWKEALIKCNLEE